jgi:peptide deformylase
MEQMVELLKEMLQYCNIKGNWAVWLALPQLGESFTGFVMSCKNRNIEERCIVINPTIVKRSPASDFLDEECLSEPGVLVRMKRSNHIQVIYTDQNGKKVERMFYGFPARVFQHEYDHLDGILLSDYAKV